MIPARFSQSLDGRLIQGESAGLLNLSQTSSAEGEEPHAGQREATTGAGSAFDGET